jgi:hypothetical protein
MEILNRKNKRKKHEENRGQNSKVCRMADETDCIPVGQIIPYSEVV